MYRIEFTRQYLKDLKLARKRNFDENKLNQIIQLLFSGSELPEKHKNHFLKGNYKGLYECHISPDWLLIYSKNETIRLITLIRTGTHSDLF
jgi:mRNA interferase YafQ